MSPLLLSGALALALAGAQQAPREAPAATDARARPLTVAILGDRTGLAKPGVTDDAAEKIDLLRPDLVVVVGDLIEGYTQDAADLKAEWDEAERTLARLRAPVIWVPGNHDIGNDAMRAMWRQRRGADWHARVVGDILFLTLNSEDPPRDMPPEMAATYRQVVQLMRTDPQKGEAQVRAAPAPSKADMAALHEIEKTRISRAQVDFVRKALADHADVRWTVVLIHKPAWREDNAEFKEIEGLLAGRNYTVVAGHVHEYSHETRHGRSYYTAGPSGALSFKPGPNTADQIGWLTFGEGAPRMMTMETGTMRIEREAK